VPKLELVPWVLCIDLEGGTWGAPFAAGVGADSEGIAVALMVEVGDELAKSLSQE
jgi:hypothetical protein